MNCVVDAACASSLIALKVAIDELLYGDCDQMITGATCTDNSIGMFMAFSKTPVFSTDAGLTAYDENTKGMLIGEGSVMFVLKRYADAVSDGDTIHAVIKGCASSSDGKASGIYSPTIAGQEEALRRAYARANVDPKTVTLVEGHGTGTPVGDRIELTALSHVFQDAGNEHVAVGSIKSQIGHLKACAGYAGMVKVILAMKHKTLPASINVKNPPKLMDGSDLQSSPLYINTKTRPWFTDPGVPRRAGVSSFGFGGANYHAVLEEYEPEQTGPYRMTTLDRAVVISEPSVAALLATLKKLTAELPAADRAGYEAFTAKHDILKPVPRTHARVGFLAVSQQQCVEVLEACVARLVKDATSSSWSLIRQGAHFRASGLDTAGKVAALFSGQGAQYTHMFSDVAQNWPQFRQAVSVMDKAGMDICGARISSVMYPRENYAAEPEQTNEVISTVLNAQQATVASSLGSYDIFKDAGFRPDFVAGHSLGEFSALYAAELATKEQVAEIVCHRASIMANQESGASSVQTPGAMAAIIGKDADQIRPSKDRVWIANKNSRTQVVLTGDSAQLKEECKRLQDSGFKVVSLACSDAFHSPFMKTYQSKFQRKLGEATMQRVKASPKLYSNVTAQAYAAGSDPKDLLSQHMVSSVLFDEQIRKMYADGARVFVEFGPKQTLTKLVQSILDDKSDCFCLAVNPTSRTNSETLLRECAVKLAVLGLPLENFDKWQLANPFVKAAGKRKKTTLRLSAATYKSKKSMKETERIMNDGRKVSFVACAPAPAVDTKKTAALEADVAAAKEEQTRLREELQRAKQELEKMRAQAQQQAQEAEAAAKASVRNIDMELVKRHRDMIAKMLGEYEHVVGRKPKQAAARAAPTPVSAPVSAPTPSISSSPVANAAHAEKVVLEVLAAKTGYEVDMIEADMDLETELGIDSIKRVEILSEVQSILNVEAKDVDALSRTKTVGEVIDAMNKEVGGGPQCAPAPVEVTTTAAASTAAPIAPASSASSEVLAKAERVVMEVLAAKTGYEVDMIEADMELETELGIDSIKRVEILSEVQAQLSIEAKDVDALSRTKTVGEVVDAMKKEIGGSEPAPVVAKSTPSAPPAAPAGDLSKAEQVVMEVLASKTGYEVDMIEADMELETELGIDSIKRVEILSEVQSILNVEAKDVDALSRTKTVGEVVDAMKKEISNGSPGAPAAIEVSEATTKQPTQQAVAVPAGALAKAEQVVMEVLATKTGYEVDMIEADMELETELGIDSIKRVEILSEVQAILQVEAKDVDALSRTKTVGEVVDAMKKEISSASPAAAKPVAQVETPKAVAPSRSAPSSALLAKAETVVLEVLAAKTGYEVDMVELDMELETELGIDSIKRVEILSEVQSILNVEAKDVDALSRTRTVGEVVEAMKKELSSGAAETAEEPEAEEVTAHQPTSAPSSALLAKAETVVLEVLAAKTGYEVDMVELDMELETELGIDSIKRVEILSEVQSILNVEAKDVDALSRTRTVGEVVEAMKKELGSSATAAPVSSVSKEASVAAPTVPAVDSNLLAKAEEVVMEVLAAKTGYEVDMIEADMELETELGIDSIKRVEILSEVQAELSIEAKDVDALSRTKTVGEVVDAMKKEINSASPATAKAVVTVETPKAVAPSTTAPSSALLAKAETVVLEVLAAKTGYEVDMVELDMELETELGIDSIKRVEILSEVQAILNVEAKDVDALSRTRTVGEVVDAMKKELSNGDAPPAPLLTPTSSTAVAVGSSAVLAKAESVVLEVLATKTGYEVDMIEEDMELETELGIDSIKRVEILSEVQAELNIEAKDVDALSRTRTVGEVISAMKAEISGSSPQPAAAVSSSEAVPASQQSASSEMLERAETVVLEVLAAKTGYEVDMVELDMELETELGIDSIKRVEILSEVQSILNVEAKDVDALSRTRTVGEVVEAMKKELGSSATAAPVSSVSKEASVAAPTVPAVDSNLLAKAEEVVMEVLAAKTGYEVDMIEADMELETELGIDSIKRVEILSEVQAQLSIEAKDVDALSRTKTVGEVVDAMKKEIGGSASAGSSVTATPATSTTFEPIDLRAIGCEELDLAYPQLCKLTPPPQLEGHSLGKVLIYGSRSAVVTALQGMLSDVVVVDRCASEAALTQALSSIGQVNCVVYLHDNSAAVSDALLLAKHVKKQLGGAMPKFISVVRGDGSLGYSGEVALSELEQYSLCGLMKTADLEWTEVSSRCVDMHASLAASTVAELIVAELKDCCKTVRETGYRADGQRMGVLTKSLNSAQPSQAPSSDDVWLVTGGARGITPLCIRELAKRTGGGTYYLMGRSKLEPVPQWAAGVADAGLQKAAIQHLKSIGEKPRPAALRKLVNKIVGTREVEANLKAIKEFGKAEYISCDVTSTESVKKVVDRLGKVTGIFHASGVLRDKLIEQKKVEDFQMVWDTKVVGFNNVWSCVDKSSVKHVVLFSSLAGFHGNVGQSDYSMANEVLNKLAYMLEKQHGIDAKAFDFGPWDGGMVSPALKKAFQEKGVQIIDRAGGADTVARIMCKAQPSQILVGNWGIPPAKPEEQKNVVKLQLKSEQYLDAHRIQGKRVLPFTFSTMTLVDTVQGLYPGYAVVEANDLTLFRGINIDQEVNAHITVKEEGEKPNGRLSVSAAMKIELNGKLVPAYKVTVQLAPRAPSSKMVAVESLEGKTLSKQLVYEKVLFHGTAFQGLESVTVSGDKLQARCHIPAESEVPTNKLALDLVFQAALVLAFEARGIASLPATSQAVKMYKGVESGEPFTIALEKQGGSRSDSVWMIDFAIHNEKGDVFSDGNVSIVLNDTLKY